MRSVVIDAVLAVCIATITAESLSENNLSSDTSVLQEDLPGDLSWNDPEALLIDGEYDLSGGDGDLLVQHGISSSTMDLASSSLEAPSCLLNGDDQPLLRRARVRRDEAGAPSSCDATSKFSPYSEGGKGLDELGQEIWKNFYESPYGDEPDPEESSDLFPIFKDPAETNENCLPEFPKHLCCLQMGTFDGEFWRRPIYSRMYQCAIGKYDPIALAPALALPPAIHTILDFSLNYLDCQPGVVEKILSNFN